jgi:hypothetical protein
MIPKSKPCGTAMQDGKPFGIDCIGENWKPWWPTFTIGCRRSLAREDHSRWRGHEPDPAELMRMRTGARVLIHSGYPDPSS